MKSPPQGKVAWADFASTKFSITCPEFILIDSSNLTF